MRQRTSLLALASAVAVVPATCARAQPPDDAAEEVASTPEAPPSRTSVDLILTNFADLQLVGDGDTDPKLGGKVDLRIVVDGRDLGLWDGLTINAHPEIFYGRNFNGAGNGAVLPVNTALFRANGESNDFDLSLNVTQRVGNGTLTIGKMNMIAGAAATPIAGGGGLDGFQHLQLAAPISFNTPPYAFGGLLNMPVGGIRVTVGLWDSEDATGRSGFENAFANGVSGFATLTVPATIGGRQGFYGFTIGGTTADSLDLEDIPDIILPPVDGATISQKSGGWQLRFSFQQFLWQDSADPRRGWGLFGYVGLWDGNPTIGRWSMAIGAAGSPPIASRPRDRFGLAYFRFAPSGVLIRGLAPIVAVGAEQGVEAFYTIALAPNVMLTANVQVIDPATLVSASDFFAGLRTTLRF